MKIISNSLCKFYLSLLNGNFLLLIILILSFITFHSYATLNAIYYPPLPVQDNQHDFPMKLNGMDVTNISVINLPTTLHFNQITFDAILLNQQANVHQYVTWFDRNGVLLSDAQLTHKMGGPCDEGYLGPYTLKVTRTFDAENDAYSINHNYTITNGVGAICGIKPNSLIAVDEASPEFSSTLGFNAEGNVNRDKFPTTAFPGAEFTLEMLGGNKLYDFKVIDGQNLVSQGEGRFIFSSTAPIGSRAYRIRARLKADPVVYFDYMFNLKERGWFEPKLSNMGGFGTNYLAAVEVCGDEVHLPMLEDFIRNDYLTRAIGKGIFAEWGAIFRSSMYGYKIGNYKKSTWKEGVYWTQKGEKKKEKNPVISSNYSYVLLNEESDRAYTVCVL